jgi:hypothetical protein
MQPNIEASTKSQAKIRIGRIIPNGLIQTIRASADYTS